MNLSINGQSQVPPGFRFHPTEEELLHYYLRKKVAFERIDLDVIREVDLNKLEPWDIQERCKIGSTPQNDWYFFSHKDKKYPTGTRTNRATAAGFWKATGRDKIIYSGFRRIGLRKTLVFYKGRAPHGQKSDWIMHEYRLDENTNDSNVGNPMGAEAVPEEGWVVCRVFKKKNYQKSLESPKASSMSVDSNPQMSGSRNEAVLDQILMYMGRTCKMENEALSNINISDRFLTSKNIGGGGGGGGDGDDSTTVLNDRSFMHLPRLDSPSTLPSLPHLYQSMDDMLIETEPSAAAAAGGEENPKARLNDWVALDRLVASQLNGQEETSKQLSCFGDPSTTSFCSPMEDHDIELSPFGFLRSTRANSNINNNHHHQNPQVYNTENDLWSFTRSSPSPSPSPSSSDPLCHLSV
ncbi:hypothetical protein UlMin_001687 [Ulmus minor]